MKRLRQFMRRLVVHSPYLMFCLQHDQATYLSIHIDKKYLNSFVNTKPASYICVYTFRKSANMSNVVWQNVMAPIIQHSILAFNSNDLKFDYFLHSVDNYLLLSS